MTNLVITTPITLGKSGRNIFPQAKDHFDFYYQLGSLSGLICCCVMTHTRLYGSQMMRQDFPLTKLTEK